MEIIGVVEPVLEKAIEPLECDMMSESGRGLDWRLELEVDRVDNRFIQL